MKSQATPPYWDPLWLRKSVLFAFMATFILFSVGLVLMWYLVNRFDGIPLTLTTNHYAWTYGPTAILTMVVSLWRRVNYCTMVNQPWQELHNGPQEASKTVLLDYIWPLQATSFISALKNRHLAVATSIMIFTLLRLVMVISTTLFVLGNSSLSQNIRIRLLTKFYTKKSSSSGGPDVVTGDLAWDYWNLKEKCPDVAPPVELSIAFTNYSIISEIPGGAGKASAQVDIFQVNVTCEPATVGWSQDYPTDTFNLTLNTPSCDIGRIEMAACGDAQCVAALRSFGSLWVGCTSQGTADPTLYDSSFLTDKGRFAIIAIESDVSETDDHEYNVSVRRVAAVSCGLEYSINQGIAHGPAFDTSKIDSLQVTERVLRRINYLSSGELLGTITSSISIADVITTDPNSIPINLDSISTMWSQDLNLQLLGLLAGSRAITTATLDPLLNTSSLQRRAEETLTGLSHQLMRRYFLHPDNTIGSGSVYYTEQRLYIRPAALWSMVALLSILSCLVIVVIPYTKRRVAPQYPATTATAAYTISRSPTIGTLLGESSAIRLSEIRKELANYNFATVQDRAGMLRVNAVAIVRQETLPKPPSWLSRKWKSISSNRTKDSADVKPGKKRNWMPYSSRRHAIALTIILPIIAIAALEILWHFSENDEHFVTVSSDSSIAAYAIRYGSTVTVLIISTLFNALDFAIATMTPFSALAAGDATAERTMFFTIAGDIPPVALYKAAQHMHFGAALSLVASTVGSLLTIVTSGLWFDTAIEISRDVAVEIQSAWSIDFTGNRSPSHDTEALINDLQHGGPDVATLIWGNVVLPMISNVQPSITSESNNTFNGDTLRYNIAVPAIRPLLECSVLSSSSIAVDEVPDNTGLFYERSIIVAIQFPLAVGCGSSSLADPPSTFNASNTYTIYDNNTTIWIGQLWDLSNSSGPRNLPSGDCPSLGAIFGTYKHGDQQTQSDITALVCTQRLQWVEANTTYHGNLSTLFTPNLTTDVHLNSWGPQNITDARSGSSSLLIDFSKSFSTLDMLTTGDRSQQFDGFDRFFNHLVYGLSGTIRQSLIGSENVHTLISVMNNVYQRFMVRVIDREWRSAVDGKNLQPSPNGRVARGSMTVTASRLKLNKTSKTILEAFLGTMVLLGGIAWWCVDMRVLPRNPYPIASSMALFAGSRLTGASIQAPSGRGEQEQPRTIKRKPLVMVKGKRFRLGWWKDPSAEADDDRESNSTSQAPPSTVRRRFGIDVEDEDKAVPSTVSKTTAVSKRR
ncbi:hypothetical protein E0Z10_g10262 [Xylaria hypoxylon]|uniref:Uncharacterized protein n=1 Tax=Xylaria hypoxylon TaxID=37992 RepID=A0A4Z0Y6K9_9PEZI|nr:hypothetical protein E0Z10_g10262 [Xylaria hypoxylon]